MALIGFARVSTQQQDLSEQIQALKEYGCKKIFSGKHSGKAEKNKAQLDELLDYVREGDVVAVTKLDRLGRSLAQCLNTLELFKNKNIFIMRAFTKFFAIPGLRLGYGIGFDDEILNKMWDEKEPWTVNTFANLAGLVMLDDKEYIEKSEKWILEEKKFMYKELSEFQYLKAYKTECNFILLKIQNISSASLRDKMIEKNILIRDASNFKFLDYHFVRLAIKDRESNIKVLEALADIMEYRG